MRLKPGWPSAFLLVLLLAGCGQEPDHFSFVALGTEVTLTIFDAENDAAKTSARALETLLLERGQDWYPWADGELAQLNAALARGQSTPVSPELSRLLIRAAELELLSDGRFNAGLGALTELWGFHRLDQPPQALPDPREIRAIIERMPGLWALAGNEQALALPRVVIDPGGIAKGALLAESRTLLADYGIEHAIINLGGDLLVIGDRSDRPVSIGIRSPFENRVLAGLDIRPGEAVMSSGNYERYFELDGRRYNHILDPDTGYPVDHTAAVTVVHEDPLLADAAATALLVGGSEAFFELTEALSIDLALIVLSSGDVVLTPQLSERLNWGLDKAP